MNQSAVWHHNDHLQQEQEVVIITCTLLGLDQPGGSVDADDQAARDLRVKRAAVTRLLDSKDPPDPRHDLVG